jgi:hypothetical protein
LVGHQQALVLLDEWVLSPRRLQHDEALGEAALRYVTSATATAAR